MDDLNAIASQGYLTPTGIYQPQSIADRGYLTVVVLTDTGPPAPLGGGGGGAQAPYYERPRREKRKMVEEDRREREDEEAVLAVIMVATLYRLME